MSTADGSATAESAASTRRRWWLAGGTALGFGLWWGGSILLHMMLFWVVAAATPKSSMQPGASNDFQMTISAAHVEAVVADIRKEQAQEFTKKVAELTQVKDQLDVLEAKKIEQYNALMQEEARDAPKLAQAAVAKALESQQAALKSQTVTQAAIAKVNESQAQLASAKSEDEKAAAQKEYAAATQATESAQSAVNQAQNVASAAQIKVTQQVNLFGGAMADVAQAAKTAADAQTAAGQQQDAAVESRNSLQRAQQQVERFKQEADRAKTADDEAKARVDVIEKRLAELQTPPAPPSPSVSPTPAAPVPPTIPHMGIQSGTVTAAASPAVAPVAVPQSGNGPAASAASPATARPPATPTAAQAKQLKQELDRLTRSLPQATTFEARLATRLTNSEQKLATRQSDFTRGLTKLQTDENIARQKQQAAMELQAKAGQDIAAALAKPDLAPASAVPSANPVPAAPSDANLAQLFDQAKQMETAVADSYKNVRAAELAAIRKMPLAEAKALTEVAKPVRDEIDTAMLTKPLLDVAGVRAQEKTIQAASAQMNAMVALAQRMKALAEPDQQASVSVTTMKIAAAQTEWMEQLAAEDEGTKAKDLSAAMTGGGAPAASANDHAAALAQATAAMAAATGKLAANPLDAQAAVEYSQAFAALSALAAQGAAMIGGNGATDQFVPGTVPGVPVLNAKEYKPIPGRTITHSMVGNAPGREPVWMFVDSWYIIGPWPNPGRKNLNTKFPPESIIDLAAVYTGARKDEAPLPIHWQFHQDTAVQKVQGGREWTGMIVPPRLKDFEIYYAYTELWLDEAAELWVAIGSDDQSKIWLNDQMIWKSADYYKSWIANEGLRKVHFEKGINRVLYRLENGQNGGGYSFMVCLNPNAPPPIEAKAVTR